MSAVTEGICFTIIMIFVPLYVRRTFEGTNLVVIASVLAVPALTRFIASNFWGALADFTKTLKPFVLIGLTGHAACLVGLSASDSAASVVLIASAASLVYAATTPISLSYVTLLRETEKGRAVGDLMLFQSLGWFVGGIACAYLFDPELGIPVRSVLLGSAAIALVVLGFVSVGLAPLHIRKNAADEASASSGGIEKSADRRGGVSQNHGGWLTRLVADLKVLYRTKSLAATLLVVGVATGGVWVYFGNFSVYMTEHIGGSTGAVGWVMALSALFGMLAFGPSGRLVDKFGSVRILLIAILAYVVTYTLVSFTVNPLFVSVLLCVPVYPPFNVSSAALVSELSGESRRAGGLGILNGAQAVSLALGSLLGGAIGDAFGLKALPRWAFGVELVTFVAAVVAVALFRTPPLNAGREPAVGSR
ncbi:MAG: MFS transporter [Candidatus Eisenbacteria bacterium]|nr:MFS transporter [Candidatus Eisenbacteria bacterium]